MHVPRPLSLAMILVLGVTSAGGWRALVTQRERLAAERANVAALQDEVRVARERVAAAEAGHAAVAEALAAGSSADARLARLWAARVELLKQLLAELPRQSLPELRLLGPLDWIQAVREGELDTPEKLRAALARLRAAGRKRFAEQLQSALRAFVEKSGGDLPSDLEALAPFLSPPADREMLARYALQRRGAVGDRNDPVLVEQPTSDMILSVSLDGWSMTNGSELLAAPGETEMDALARAATAMGDMVDPQSAEWMQQFMTGMRALIDEVLPKITAEFGDSMDLDFKDSVRRFKAAAGDEPLTNLAQLLPHMALGPRFVEVVRPFFAQVEYLKEHGHAAANPAELRPYLERPFDAPVAFKAVKVQFDEKGEGGSLSFSFSETTP